MIRAPGCPAGRWRSGEIPPVSKPLKEGVMKMTEPQLLEHLNTRLEDVDRLLSITSLACAFVADVAIRSKQLDEISGENMAGYMDSVHEQVKRAREQLQDAIKAVNTKRVELTPSLLETTARSRV